MTNLEQSIKNGIRILEKEVERNIRSKSYKITEWKGKKVIPIYMWEKLVSKTKDENILMEYLPEDLIDRPFPYESVNDNTRKKRESWVKNWIEYMHENKKTSYGKYLCQSCFIHPDMERHSSGLYDVFMKGVDVKSPCQVVNYYACPYAETNGILFTLKKVFEITKDMISYTEQLSWGRGYTYFVDFEKNRGEEYHDLYSNSTPVSRSDVDMLLKWVEYGRIPLETVDDLYSILTSEKSLEIVFDQYVQHKRTPNSLENISESEIASKVKELESIKDFVIKYFASIKSSISIEEFRKSENEKIKQEKSTAEWYKSHYKRSAEDPRIRENQTKSKNGICMNCFGFANIFCVNCNKWICDIHWRDHREKFHNKNGFAASV